MTEAFRSTSYATRVLSGPDALSRLGDEVRRLGCERAFVVSGRSLGTSPRVRSRVEAAVGAALVGWSAGIEKDSTYRSVAVATEEARAAGADLVVALGGGSVIVAGRAVAIFLAEPGDPFEIMTQYPEGAPAHSPRLLAPKPPVINVVTTPTTAMNRAGTGLKNDDLDHRMEYFDPKTRPATIIWDDELLMVTPLEVYRSAAATLLAGAVLGAGSLTGSPLADGDRLQAFRLAVPAFTSLGGDADDAQTRLDLMAVAFLSNRLGDIAPLDRRGPPSRASWGRGYAINTALHLRYAHIGQGEATAATTPAVIRRYPLPALTARAIAEMAGLDVPPRDDASALNESLAGYMSDLYAGAGFATRLRDLGVPREDFPAIVRDTEKNFNANPGVRDERQATEALGLLEDAW